MMSQQRTHQEQEFMKVGSYHYTCAVFILLVRIILPTASSFELFHHYHFKQGVVSGGGDGSTTLAQRRRDPQRILARRPLARTTRRAHHTAEHQPANKKDVAAAAAAPGVVAIQQPTGLYVHWPFCRRRCRYCDFAVVPTGTKQNEEDAFDADTTAPTASLLDLNYTRAILQELEHAERQYRAAPLRIQSIYFGGGTPSLAPIESLVAIIDFIRRSEAFWVADDCEITIEVDPGTFAAPKLAKLKSLGFNRLSFGVQSFDDATLAFIGRTHRAVDIDTSLEAIRQVFSENDDVTLNWSIDLISGLPGVSLAQWIETLEHAVATRPQPTHISVYDLQVEQGTVFGSWFGNKDDNELLERRQRVASSSSRRLPTPEDAAFMYKFASGYLRAYNYEHYEVSSYALRSSNGTSFRSRHNQIYWANDGQWLAFGMGASSYMNRSFTVRPRLFRDYLDWANALSTHPDNKSTENIDMTNDSATFDRLTDIVLKRLRTSDGLDMLAIRDRFGRRFCNAILRGSELALSLNLATYDAATGILRLRDPDGFLFSNSIISSVFVELEVAASTVVG